MNAIDPVKRNAGKNSDRRRERWVGQRQARRAEIVEAAVRAIHIHGPDLGMDAIAAEAGVSKPVIYRHFADQADLYHAVGRQAAEWLIAWLGQYLDPETKPHDLINGAVDAFLRAIEADPPLYKFVIRRAFDTLETNDSVEGYRQIVVRQVESVLRNVISAPELGPTVYLTWAHSLVGLVESTANWWLDNPGVMEREDMVRQLSTLIMSGVRDYLPSDDAAGPSDDDLT